MFTIAATKALDAYANDPALMAIMIGLGSWALLATLAAVWMRAATDGCRVVSDDADEAEYLRATIVANRLARAVRDRSVPSERVQRVLDIIKQTEKPAQERGTEYGKLMATGYHASTKTALDDVMPDHRPSVSEWDAAFKKAGGDERLDDSKPLKHEGLVVAKPPTKREYAEQRPYDPSRPARNAKAKGKRAFAKGLSLIRNPFDVGANHDAWTQGWLDAQVASFKEQSK